MALALRYIVAQGHVTVVRLHHSYTQADAQRIVDLAMTTPHECAFWSADETLHVFDPQTCTLVQILELERR
jgi:hypothetical protein